MIIEIRVRGCLHGRWQSWFDGLDVQPQAGGETIITGPIIDQAALHGVLAKVRDLGLLLLAVTCFEPETQPKRRENNDNEKCNP